MSNRGKLEKLASGSTSKGVELQNSVGLFFTQCRDAGEWKTFLSKEKLVFVFDSQTSPDSLLKAFCKIVELYFDFLVSPGPHDMEDKSVLKWQKLEKLFHAPIFSPTFCQHYKKLSYEQQKLIIGVLLNPTDNRVSLLSTGPLLYSSIRKHIIKQDLCLIEFRYISRKVRFFQSKAQHNVFRISYCYSPIRRFEAISTTSNPNSIQSLIVSLSKKIRNETQRAEEQQNQNLAALLPQSSVIAKKNTPDAIQDIPPEIPKPQCLPLPAQFTSPAFRQIYEQEYAPKDEVITSANKFDSSHWPFGTVEVTLNEEGKISLNLKESPIVFQMKYCNSSIAPETFIEQDLPSKILQNEDLIRRISSNMKCVHAIFEKLSQLQKESSTTPTVSGMKLSPQEEEVLALPDNVLLLGRSGTGKTTCALLRLFARYKLFEEHKKSLSGELESSQHFHPLFITLSPVLCSQARKYFQKLISEDTFADVKLPSHDEIPLNMNLDETQFPLFLTLRQFLKMLDGTLYEPFFVHTNSKNNNHDLEWKNDDDAGLVQIVERKLVPIDVTLEDLMQQNQEEQERLAAKHLADSIRIEQKENFQAKRSARTSFEVNYDYFENEIYPEIYKIRYPDAVENETMRSVHPAVIWTEIQSTIKGSLDALQTPRGFLTMKQYVQIGKKRGLISKEQRNHVYYSFLAYESRKRSLGAFDLQDIIFHLFCRLRYEGYRGSVVHSISIDEVQDFSQSTLQLLMMICKQQNGFFFTGDTCQTIARGVGFRFRELQGLFYHRLHQIPIYKEKYSVPEVHQLTINFRSHASLIKMGNSIIQLLENLFPDTIDIIAPDQGTIPGPLPSIMKYTADEDLFAFLFGQAAQRGGDDGKLPEIEQFGAHQVVITRNQATKALLPEILKHALCLTIYEAKGLEFDDVILFNFFSDSTTAESWRVITPNVGSEVKPDNSHDSPSGLIRLRSSLEDEINQNGAADDITDDSEFENSTSKFLGTAKHYRPIHFHHNHHSILCSELKHLYVAVTRPRKNLYIFERDLTNASPMIRYWTENRTEPLVTMADAHQYVSKGIVQSTTPEEWRKQGQVMLDHQYYPQAVQCFTYSNDDDLLLQATALLKTKQAGDMQKRLHSCINPSEQQILQETIQSIYKEAAEIFLSISFNLQAAQCFASCGEYKTAGELFQACASFTAAAEAFIQASEHKIAAECFLNAKLIPQAAEQYFVAKNFFSALELIQQNSELFDGSLNIQTVVREAICSFVASETIHWAEIVRCVSFLSQDVAVLLDNAINGSCSTSDDLLNQLHNWGLNELNIKLLEHSLGKERNLFFYKRLQAYAFVKCFYLHEKIQKLDLQELSEAEQAEESKKLKNEILAALCDLQESDQVQILLTLGYFSLLGSLEPSPMIISLLGSFGRRDLLLKRIRVSDDRELYLQVLLDCAYDEAFYNSPLSMDTGSLEVISLMEQIDSILAVYPKGKAPRQCLESFQLLQSCMEPGTRIPFLVSSFTKQKSMQDRDNFSSDRVMHLFFISSFLLLSNHESHKPQQVIECLTNVLEQIFKFLHSFANPRHSKTYANDILDVLSVFNLSKDIRHSVGFPGSVTIQSDHVLHRLLLMLYPTSEKLVFQTEEKTFYRYPITEVIATMFYSLLATACSLLNFACYDLSKTYQTEYLHNVSHFTHNLAQMMTLLNAPEVKQTPTLAHLVSRPKRKMQWLLNEHSIPPLSYLYQKADRMAGKLTNQLETLWFSPGSLVSPTAKDKSSIITFAKFKWNYIRDIKGEGKVNRKLYSTNYMIRYRSQCDEIQRMLALIDKEDILAEFLQHDESRPAKLLLSFGNANPLHKFVCQMNRNQQKGYLLQSIRLVNEMFVYANEADMVEILLTFYCKIIEKHFAYAVALFSALESVDVYIPTYWIDWLYEIPCDPIIPENLGDLMNSLLELMFHVVQSLGVSNPGGLLTVPLAVLSYNCSIPSAGYDDELLDLVWQNKDNFEFYGVLPEILLTFLKQMPLMTGEESEMEPETFISEAIEALDCSIVSFRLTEFSPCDDAAYDDMIRKQKLLRAQRITAAHHICSFVRGIQSQRVVPKDRTLSPMFYYFNSSMVGVSLSVSFSNSFHELLNCFTRISRALFFAADVPADVVFEISFPLFKAYQTLWDVSHSYELIAGEYQTILSSFEDEMNSTRLHLQNAYEQVNQFVLDDTEDEKQEAQGRGTQAWRQRQIQKLLRQRQGLRKQHALQQKVERIRNQ